MSLFMRRAIRFFSFSFLALALALWADRAWVGNRDLSTITVFDATTGVEEAGSPVTVGAGPMDIASDRVDSEGPQQIFVVNSGSNTVSILGTDPIGGAATVVGGGLFGTFVKPSAVVRVQVGTKPPVMAITDQKVTSGSTPTGRSTIRFMSPVTHAIVDDFRDPSASARYNDVVWTWSAVTGGRLWIADDGDNGVVVVRLNVPAPFFLPDTLVFNGPGEFADFIRDSAATPTFLKSPRRLATNGSVVVAVDGATSKVTLLDVDYPGDHEEIAVLANVDLPAGAGFGIDVEIVGPFAYVTSTGVPNLHRISLGSLAISGGSVALASVGGLGATLDGTRLFVGAATLSPAINSFDLTLPWPSTTVPLAFGGSFPFAFYVSPVASVTWVSGGGLAPGEGGSSKSQCGLLGAEGLLLLLVLRLARKA
jgi:hypothetical protein